MRRATVIAVLAALGAVAVALGARLPDTVSTASATYARRGSLGANDYVATNVAPCKSAYRIVTVADGRLHDRAVNVVRVTGDVTLETPQRRTVAGYARAFCVSLSVEASGDCRIALEGPARVFVRGGAGDLTLAPGRYVMQLLEIGENEYVAEVAELEELE